MNTKEIQAILTLLEDPDAQVHEAIFKSLMDMGVNVVPDLEKAWEFSGNGGLQDKIEGIIHKIQLNFIHQSLSDWVKNGAEDLLEGAYIVAKYQYPDLTFAEVNNSIEKIRRDVWLEINDNLTALEKVRILNHIIYEIHKYTANTTNYYSPQNSFINQLIISKKGSPIMLGILYIVVARKLGLPIFGTNLPKNFILAYKDEYDDIMDPAQESDNVLFFINPFNKGAAMGRKELDFSLQQQNISSDDSFFQPCSNVEIIQRLMLHLIYSYEKLGYEDKIVDLQKLLKISKMPKE
ncbi:MAG: transglutaminase-like domain-containing protein [Bacteroidota bacterium]|nr:transglutaminase-like domain-containing protein [Bacteroidota bacterium]